MLSLAIPVRVITDPESLRFELVRARSEINLKFRELLPRKTTFGYLVRVHVADVNIKITPHRCDPTNCSPFVERFIEFRPLDEALLCDLQHMLANYAPLLEQEGYR